MKKFTASLIVLLILSQSFLTAFAQENGSSEAYEIEEIHTEASSKALNYSEYIEVLPEKFETTGDDITLLDSEEMLSSARDYSISFDCEQSGFYALEFEYAPIDDQKISFELEISIDGKIPFSEAAEVKLPCFYTMGDIAVNADGDDLRPTTKTDKSFHKFVFYNKSAGIDNPFEFFIEKGAHTISFRVAEGKISISNIRLFVYSPAISYDEYIKEHSEIYTGDALPLTEAESFLYTNSNYVIASSDVGSAETTPSDPINKKINVVGGSNWKSAGDIIAWKVVAPEDGLYNISFRYKQNFQSGMTSYRTLYVNGEIPYSEAVSLAFPYNSDWQVADYNLKIYLKKGENVIALEAAMGEVSSILEKIDEAIVSLNTLYRNIIMITGTSPDSYRDYNLQDEIPNLEQRILNIAGDVDRIYSQAQQFVDGSGQLHVLQDTCRQLKGMADDLRSITKGSRLSRLKSNISSLSSLSAKFRVHPLMIDSISLYGDGENNFNKVGFWEQITYRFKRFLSTFLNDYQVSEDSDESSQIDVWISSGRDQLQILKDLTDNDFTPSLGIEVNLQLVTGSLIHAVLADKAPDVALGRGETDVINFAMRGAVEDLSKYGGYSEVASRFSKNAMLPFTYKNGVYAIPETQTFQMMFVRTDILSELGIAVPNTWTELTKNVLPVLNRNNLTVGIGNLNTSGSLQSIYTTILTQSGGSLYSYNLLSADLNSTIALDSFDFVVSLYRDYGIPQEFDFINRFRTGEMPIALSEYTSYNQLQISAPEITGLWQMYEIPGIADSRGNINRSQIMSSTAAVMLSDSDKKEESWEFLTWFTSAETQKNYGLQLEAVLGESGRYATANIEAMSGLMWAAKQLSTLEAQRSKSVSLLQIPGSYYVGKALNNATVLSVTNDEIIAKEELIRWDELIDAEISRKAKEFDFKGKTEEE